MNHRPASRLVAVSLFVFLFGQGFSAAAAEEQAGKEKARTGFTVSLQAPLFSGLSFPSAYWAYKSVGGANVPVAVYLSTLGKTSAKPGLGFSLGFLFREKALFGGLEFEFSSASAADGQELLQEEIYYGATFSRENIETRYSQNGRKIVLFQLAFNFGVLPFRSFDLGVYLSAGGGYGRQSFTSPATSYAASRAYDVNTLREVEWYDVGAYDGNGAWTRGSFVYFVGAGGQWFFSRLLSLRLDYKYLASSYTRKNVLISSGPVNVYQEKKSYEYGIGNRFAVILGFHL